MTKRKILQHPEVKTLHKKDQEVVVKLVQILTKMRKRVGIFRTIDLAWIAFDNEMARRRDQEKRQKVHAHQ